MNLNWKINDRGTSNEFFVLVMLKLLWLEPFIDQVDLFLNWQGQRISNEHVFDDFSWKIRMSPQTVWMNINYFSIGHSKLRSSTYFFIRHFLHCIIISSRFSSSCNKLFNGIFISLINLPRCKLCIAVASKVFHYNRDCIIFHVEVGWWNHHQWFLL